MSRHAEMTAMSVADDNRAQIMDVQFQILESIYSLWKDVSESDSIMDIKFSV